MHILVQSQLLLAQLFDTVHFIVNIYFKNFILIIYLNINKWENYIIIDFFLHRTVHQCVVLKQIIYARL